MLTADLVGRDGVLDEVGARVRGHRLVTIVGPGGVGKTAVARVAGARLASSFPLGVRDVDLARIDDPSAVPGALASQLGFDSFDALLALPGDRPVLLVVDNCEHVLDACATALATLLGACLQPVVIATSRAPLELPGESIVTLAPLPIPLEGTDPSENGSVQLLLQRMRDAGAEVTPDDLDTVAELCRRLDGLPLALEVAAARSRTMGVGEILARLDETIDVLERPRFRGDPRHRSIADTIRWSYDLLTPSQADLLDQLAVFSGPFTSEDARSIAGTTTSVDSDLEELVSASLVVVDVRAVPTRYRLLDTIRRFALDQLRRRRLLDQAYDRYVDHVIGSVRRLIAGSSRSWRPALVRDLVDRYDDIAEALNYAIAHDEVPDRAFELCGTMWGILHQGHADDIVVLCRRTLVRWPADGSTAAAAAVAALATAEYVTGHPDTALDLVEQTIAELRDDGPASVTLHRCLGQSRRALGDLDGAVEAFRAGAAIAHRRGATAMALELDIAAATVVADLGDTAAGVAGLEVAVRRSDEIGSAISSTWARTALGWVQLRIEPSVATGTIESALEQSRSIDYSIGVAVGLRSRAFAHLLAGQIEDAAVAVGALLDDLVDRGALSNLRLLADVAAATAYRCGNRSWEALVATARTLPITTLTAADFELVRLPTTAVAPLRRLALIDEVRQLLADVARTDGQTRGATATTRADEPGGSITRRGDTVELEFAGRAVSLRTTKGLSDIVRLIEADGAEITSLDLADAVVEQASTGETIDATARRQYEERIRDLQNDIDEAESHSDFERSYRHQAELDQLIEHLSAAIGTGNRTRRGADSAERARSAVTHRVRSTIRQMAKVHPQLGAHLEHSVNTGTYCSYRPERPTTWRVE